MYRCKLGPCLEIAVSDPKSASLPSRAETRTGPGRNASHAWRTLDMLE